MSDGLEITNNSLVAKTKAGTIKASFKGSSVSVYVDDGKKPHYEQVTALPKYDKFFDKLKNTEPLRPGDLVVVKYSDGTGYMEMVTKTAYNQDKSPSEVLTISTHKAKKADGTDGEPLIRKRLNLVNNSSFDAATGTYTYKGVWDTRYPDGMTFTILRAKSGENKVNLGPASSEADRISKEMEKKEELISKQDPDKKHSSFVKTWMHGRYAASKTEWEKKDGYKQQTDAVKKEREEYNSLKTDLKGYAERSQSAEAQKALEDFNKKYASKYPPTDKI